MTECSCQVEGFLDPRCFGVGMCGLPNNLRLAKREVRFDTQCYDLAAAFLEDHPGLFNEANNAELAQEIQRTIDEFIEDKKRNYEPPDPPGWEGGFAENH